MLRDEPRYLQRLAELTTAVMKLTYGDSPFLEDLEEEASTPSRIAAPVP
jgi:hypothetical protein